MRTLLLFLALPFLCPTPAFSQIIPYSLNYREWEVVGFAGVASVTDMDFDTSVVGNGGGQRNVEMHYASGYQLGVRLTDYFADYWGADLEYSFANAPLRFTNLSPDIPSLSLSHTVHNISYSISYLFTSPQTRLRPYVRVGLGAALFYIGDDSKDEADVAGLYLRDSWKFVPNVGGGVKYLAAEQFALILDVKNHISDVPSYGLPRSARIVDGVFQPGLTRDGMLQNWQINFGFAFQWDE